MLNGAGIRTRAMFKVYVGQPVPAGEGDHDRCGAGQGAAPHPAQPAARPVRRPAGRRADRRPEGEQHARRSSRRVKAQTDQLVAIMKSFGDAQGGQRRHARLRRRRDARSGFNGAAKGTIPGEAFNRALTQGLDRRQAGAGRPQEGDARRMAWPWGPCPISGRPAAIGC